MNYQPIPPESIAELVVSDRETLLFGDLRYSCRIGKAGFIAADAKREGDHATPTGRFALRACYYRPDAFNTPPHTGLPLVPIRPDMGWCDDPDHPRYNQLVRLPFPARHEIMWRGDACYDLVIPLGFNDEPIRAGHGSAIFMHVMREDGGGTEGCVALAKADLLALLPHLTVDSFIRIEP